jgi:histidyl-tRNA synthetase
MPPIRAPKGTRDFYPEDLLRRRYVERLWRDASIRHGFEEIDGPTFESADLYKVKSGEGILAEMFGVFSGKSAEDVERVRRTGEAPYALRPEFTPTLARMYAARAGSLPKPTRWFWMQNCFRAERPQRGRLREFGQWNCDIIGGDPLTADVEIVETACDLLRAAGLTPDDAEVRVNSRQLTEAIMERSAVPPEARPRFVQYLDGVGKRTDEENERLLAEAGVGADAARRFRENAGALGRAVRCSDDALADEYRPHGLETLLSIRKSLVLDNSPREWITLDFEVVRGLAYYTGMVFEVIAEGERAIAGGGRYDNLIELFGGPPTPAVGFGMGDVVLSLLLEDKGLMPDATRAMEFLSRPPASYRPEAFVIPAGRSDEEQEAAARQVLPLTARLRRGTESPRWTDRPGRKPWDADRYDAGGGGVRPMHARFSHRSTRNIGKLMQDAAGQRARFAVIVENAGEATLKNLDTGEQDAARTPLERVPAELARRLGPA